MFDLLTLAYQSETTRVSTLMFAKDLSPASYPASGNRGGFHGASHHANVKERMDQFALINKYHVQMLAYFIGKLAATPDGDGTLLDHSMILYGSSMSNGNQHDHGPLPLVLLGGASHAGANARLAGQALSMTAAAAMTGGIFGSWAARGFAEAGVLLGVGWMYFVFRRRTARPLFQVLLLPVAVVLGGLTAIPGSNGRSPGALLGSAVRSGRVLRPPIPFDPGWRPLLIVVFAIIGFAGAWIAAGLGRPKLALAPPLGVIALTAISQAPDGQLIGSLARACRSSPRSRCCSRVRPTRRSSWSRQFEVKRLVRGAFLVVPGVLALVLLSNSSFLFPKPVYNPAEKPQKPRSVPLSAARDRVLFEVDGPITGPWIIGALDVYDGTTWRLAPYDPKRLKPVPADGVVNREAAASATVNVKFTTRHG